MSRAGAECVPPSVAVGASLGSQQLLMVGKVFLQTAVKVFIAACLEI